MAYTSPMVYMSVTVVEKSDSVSVPNMVMMVVPMAASLCCTIVMRSSRTASSSSWHLFYLFEIRRYFL